MPSNHLATQVPANRTLEGSTPPFVSCPLVNFTNPSFLYFHAETPEPSAATSGNHARASARAGHHRHNAVLEFKELNKAGGLTSRKEQRGERLSARNDQVGGNIPRVSWSNYAREEKHQDTNNQMGKNGAQN